jgi:hypothetical protein
MCRRQRREEVDMTAIIFALALLWLAGGAASLMYWWMRFLPFTKEQFWLAVGCSLLGPLAFFFVWLGIVLSGEQPMQRKA